MPDTIDAARADLLRLKSDRAGVRTAPGGVPGIEAPEWHGGRAPATPVNPARPNPRAVTRNPNWLVEAMQKSGAAREGERARAGAGSLLEAGLFEEVGGRRERSEGAPGELREAETRPASPNSLPPAESAAALNPLATFLSDWMTPQDLALLQPGLTGNLAGGAGPPVPVTPFSPASGGVSPTSTIAGGGISVPVRPSTAGLGTVNDNPFLQALAPPSANIPALSTAPPMALFRPPAAPSSNAIVSPPAPVPPSRIPELARPPSDDRYFKPLKRF